MDNNVAIVYRSSHHGNTKKILDALMARYEQVDLIPVEEFSFDRIKGCDKVGFASGVYAMGLDKRVMEALNQVLEAEFEKIFFVYTAGMGTLKGLDGKLNKICADKNKTCMGIFSCRGFDTFGPFKLVGGIAKGHPSDDDINNAILFFENEILNV